MAKQIKSSGTKEDNLGEVVLAPHESLLLWRRRKHWNQKKAAEHYKIQLFTYNFAENGKLKDFKYKKHDLVFIQDHIELYEKCFILRRRAKKTQEEIANKIGCGVYWLRLQESGRVPAKKLISYWEAKNKK